MEYCKLQIGCMLIVLYILFVYVKDKKRFRQRREWSVFDTLLVLGVIEVIFDGLTAYTVNHLEQVNATVNGLLHMFFLLSLDVFIFALFIYMVSMTTRLPKKRNKRLLLYSPFLINVILVVLHMPSLKYHRGEISNYSMGISAYTCFIMVGIYILFTFIVFFKRWNYIQSNKRISILTYLIALSVITVLQGVFPEKP